MSAERLLRWFSVVAFSLALAGVGALLVTDALRHFNQGIAHQRLGAWPLILIGISYISFQSSSKRPHRERTKGLFLGLAFVLWGSEQLLPQNPWVTLMDTLVITIFVVDIALIIIQQLRLRDHG